MTGRRSFMKLIAGALVASAIELRMATAPALPEIRGAAFAPVNYVGKFRWVHYENSEGWHGVKRSDMP